ncbi:hypothetical protein KJZ99_11765 [bacterium]|nr:hypothetical protein [bacterium]
MGRRLQLYLERLSLDELLFLETEIERRKAKFKREYSVLAIQTEQKLLTVMQRQTLGPIVRELRRHYNESAAAGGGLLLAFTPEVTVLLHRDVSGASVAATQLLTGLAEINGKISNESHRISLKLGLATGVDVLAAGSSRCVRGSSLVRRASQCAWKSPAGSMLIDERSSQLWEPRSAPVRIPIEIEGTPLYRVLPSEVRTSSVEVSDERLQEFLNQAISLGITTLKYGLLREDAGDSSNGAWSKPVARAVITVEAYDANSEKNLTFQTRCALTEYANKVDHIRRMISNKGLGLVKHEEASQITA